MGLRSNHDEVGYSGLKFNRLFMLDESKRLHVFDVKSGLLSFTVSQYAIQNIQLNYPIIPILTNTNRRVAIEFFTGNPITGISKRKWDSLMSPNVLPQKKNTNPNALINKLAPESYCKHGMLFLVTPHKAAVWCKDRVYLVKQ